jgi:thiol:disulfide interchange protein DsbD
MALTKVKKLVFSLLSWMLFQSAIGQDWAANDEPVATWSLRLDKPDAQVGETAELIFTASLARNWQMYSSDFQADIGPQPTQFAFVPDESFEAVGELRAISPKKKQDATWGTEISYFVKQAEFRQKITVHKKQLAIRGTIKGQFCHEKNGLCKLFEQPFQL